MSFEFPTTESAHEKIALEAVDRLRAAGYFRPREDAKFVKPENESQKWLLRCDTDALLDPPADPERKKLFPSADPLYDAFVAAGFRVDVLPDYNAIQGDTFRVEYHLYKKDE